MNNMKTKLASLLFSVILLSGCIATYPPPSPEPVVYYGYYGEYYGPYYYGPSGVIVFGAPYGWRGRYYYGPVPYGFHRYR
jgi:hypothetical protein